MHVLDCQIRLIVDALDFTCEQVPGFGAGSTEQTKLDARRSGIQDEYRF